MRYRPTDKLYDAFISLLAGAHGMVEINQCLRADPALQAAFGRSGCAEQSVVQQTLDACTPHTIAQMEQACTDIFRRHSQAYRHDYAGRWQLLDVDLTGQPCGPKADLATRGYFAHQRHRRGRQLGRVLATHYQEVVADRLFAGSAQLPTAMQPLLEAAEQTLQLDQARRQRTIVRADAGGGSIDNVNWVLGRGYHYHYHGRDYSGHRVRVLAQSVTNWVDDPRSPGRQVGWVEVAPTEYVGLGHRAVRRIAVRCPKPNGNGGWGVGVVLSTLQPTDILELMGMPAEQLNDPDAVVLAYVYFYDKRGGGVEMAFRDDKQGIGLTKRNKRRFEAQQMLAYLGALAHNVLVWARGWLAAAAPTMPRLARYGLKRLVREVMGIGGVVELDANGAVGCIILNQADRLACHLVMAFQSLVCSQSQQLVIILGQT